MTRILHLAERELWRSAQKSGQYTQSTRGALLEDIGFIHCSTLQQLPVVASFIYADYTGELVILELDDAAIAHAGVEIRSEDGGNGELYPHLYGALQCDWVKNTYAAMMDNGRLVAPALYEEQR